MRPPKAAPAPHRFRAEPSLAQRAKILGQGLAHFAFVTALAVLLLGWLAGVDVLVRLHPDFPAMVPSTAIGIALVAVGTLAIYRGGPGWAAVLCAVLVAACVPVSYLHLLARPNAQPGDAMSIATALSLLLSAAGLLRGSGSVRRTDTIAMVADTLGLLITAVPILGYLFSAPGLFSNSVYTAMALHTALALFALFLSRLLAVPDRGWMATLLAPEHGGVMARRFAPLLIVAPLWLCALALEATRHEILTPDFRLAVLALAMVVCGMAGILVLAHPANLSERRTRAIEHLLQESERARQQTELAATRAQKVETLGQLVSGVAHDFNNTLTVILGNLEMMRASDDADGDRPYVEDAIAAALHGSDLTGQLLAYGRRSRLEPVSSDLEKLARDTLTMFKRISPRNLEVEIRSVGRVGRVDIDPPGFRQALLNILINARDAMPDGGRIEIVLKNQLIDGGRVQGYDEPEELAPGAYIAVEVCDEGVGMSAETRARASEPFFTTKAPGKGTGLGLSMVSGFCRQSEGGLLIGASPSGGACLTMLFPRAAASPKAVSPVAGRPAPTPDPTVGILVVDDDPKITRVVSRQLQEDGHHLRTAHDAAEALEILSRGALPVLVITDIVMPGRMHGHALAAEIRRKYPDVALLLMSGYDSATARRQIEGISDVGFLQKPIRQADLRAAVARALEDHGRAPDGFPRAGPTLR